MTLHISRSRGTGLLCCRLRPANAGAANAEKSVRLMARDLGGLGLGTRRDGYPEVPAAERRPGLTAQGQGSGVHTARRSNDNLLHHSGPPMDAEGPYAASSSGAHPMQHATLEAGPAVFAAGARGPAGSSRSRAPGNASDVSGLDAFSNRSGGGRPPPRPPAPDHS